jgi:hypothetical protein
MPLACPSCNQALYAVVRLRPQPRAGRAARALYVAGGIAAAGITFVLAVLLRELWSTRTPIPGTGLDLVRYPRTITVVMPSLPVGLLPGILLGCLASRFKRFRRLRCGACGWSKDYPVDALWEADGSSAVPAKPANLAEPAVIADDAPDAWQEACAWAWAELRAGRTPEEAEAELVSRGWPRDEVESMVERTRKAVRGRR